MPEVLLWHPSDPEPLSPPRWRDPAGRRAWHFKDEIDLLRGYRASGYLNQHARDRALRRALEIVEASDAWDAAKKQVEHDSGYTAAEERADALQAEAHRVALQIAELPARTIDGIAVKARLLAHEGEGSTIDGDGEGLSGMLLKQILAFLTAAGRA
ncbi:MAG TPA: hypothetical protein VHL98_11130 [Microvirga sp.]|nr:hypothetical protein [Microvirga sp.]